jgi:prepilin-type N-terminal cleavage/methylation domain-containing protein
VSTRGPTGFTLVELLLAVTLAAMVAASALGALQLFVEADARAMDATELAVDVDRAVTLLRRDVTAATTVDLRSDQLLLEYADGTAVAWALPGGGTELHRFAGGSLVGLSTAINTLLLAATPAASYDDRGHLKDASWRASAVLQGARAIALAPIAAKRNGRTIGVSARVTHRGDGGDTVTATAVVSRVLSEQHALR